LTFRISAAGCRSLNFHLVELSSWNGRWIHQKLVWLISSYIRQLQSWPISFFNARFAKRCHMHQLLGILPYLSILSDMVSWNWIQRTNGIRSSPAVIGVDHAANLMNIDVAKEQQLNAMGILGASLMNKQNAMRCTPRSRSCAMYVPTSSTAQSHFLFLSLLYHSIRGSLYQATFTPFFSCCRRIFGDLNSPPQRRHVLSSFLGSATKFGDSKRGEVWTHHMVCDSCSRASSDCLNVKTS